MNTQTTAAKDSASIAKFIFKTTIENFKEDGFKNINSFIKSMQESSCLGNHEASFILSIIYLHGIGLKSDSLMV